MPIISLATITCIIQPQTFALRGHVKRNNVTIPIYFDNAHKFIGSNITNILNLFVYASIYIKVMVASGKNIDDVGKCHKVKLHIQDFNLKTRLYITPLGGVEIFLGVQWKNIGCICYKPPKIYPHRKWRN